MSAPTPTPVLKLRQSSDGRWFLVGDPRRRVFAGPFRSRQRALLARKFLGREMR